MLFDVSHVHRDLRYRVLLSELRYVDAMAKGKKLRDEGLHEITSVNQRDMTVSCTCGENHRLDEMKFNKDKP